jgi:hypothetical protein
MSNAIARPEGQKDAQDAIQRLVDLMNDQSKGGLAHSGVVKGVTLGTANLEVAHLLERVPTYVFSVGQNSGAVIYSDTAHPDPRNYIYLRATAAVAAWVLIA